MRNSNNAIKFLLAQYRAIFKRAYIKGLASAVILTAGLAAGQAQAAEIDSGASSWDAATSSNITINDASATFSGTNSNRFYNNVIVNSGNLTVTAEGDDKALIIKGTLTVNADGKLVVGDGSTSSGMILGWNANSQNNGPPNADNPTGDLVVESGGELELKADTGNLASIQLDQVNLKTGSTTTLSGTSHSQWYIGAGTHILAGTAPTENSGFVIESGATVTLKNQAMIGVGYSANGDRTAVFSVDGNINLQGSNLSGGLAMLRANDVYTSTGWATDKSQNSRIEIGDNANIKVSGSGMIASPETIINGGTIDVQSGTLLLNGDMMLTNSTISDSLASKNVAAGHYTMTDGTLNIQANGTLIVGSGKYNHDDARTTDVNESGAMTTLDIQGGELKGAGTLKVLGGLKISGKTLKSFVNVTGKGGKVLTSGGDSDIEFTDATDLSDFTWASSTASFSDFAIAGHTTVRGTTLTISSDLSQSEGDMELPTGGKGQLTVRADNLTLGKDGINTSGDLRFSGATAQNLTFAGTFSLANDVTLSATRAVNQDGTELEVIDGQIIGDATFVSGGSLKVEQGNYKASGDFTFSGGTLTVQNKDTASKLDSTLALSGDLDIHTAGQASGEIIVDGKNATNAVTSLDITDADLTLTADGANLFKVTVQNSGELLATGTQIDELLNTEVTGSNSGAQVIMSGGTISLDGNLTLDASQVVNTANANGQLVFSGTGNTFNVDGSLTLTGTSAINIGANNDIVARNLQLNNVDTSSNKATLQTGDVTVLKSLTSTKATNIISLSGGNLNLGGWAEKADDVTYDTALSQGGTIGANLSLDAAGSTLTVANGTWIGSSTEATVSAGQLVVGKTGKVDANGQAITATLDISKLTVGVAAGTQVNVGSTLNVDQLDASGSAITVNGIMNVDGKYDSGTKTDASDDTFGINLAAGSVTVGQGANVYLGEDAVRAITVGDTKDETDGYITYAANTFGGKVFSVDAGSEVEFAFGKDVTFKADTIKEFRDDLFEYDTTKGVIDGFIILGAAKIDGLAVDEKTNTVDWGVLKGYTDILADVTTQDLAQAKVTNIENNAYVRGNLGSLTTDENYASDTILVDGNLTLNNAAGNEGNFATNANGEVLGLEVTEQATVRLNNGGNIGTISFSESGSNLIVDSANGTTTIAAIDGSEATAAFTTGTAVVAGTTDVAQLTTEAGTTTTFRGAVTVGEDATGNATSNIAGTTTFEADATFAQAANLAGTTNFKQNVSFDGITAIKGETTVAEIASFDAATTIANNGVLRAQDVVLTANSANPIVFSVGVDTTSTTTNEVGTGYLEVESFTLAGNDLVVDPAYSQATSIAAISGFADGAGSITDAGTVDGRIFVGRNAALDVGSSASIAHMQQFIQNYQRNGSLVEDEVGAVMYLSDKLTVENEGRIILDSQRSSSALLERAKLDATGYGDGTAAADLYLGQNTVLAIGDNILEDGAAIHFDKTGAGIMAEDASATIVLDGDKFLNSRNIVLFTDDDGGVKVLGDNNIRVETLNGVMYFEYEAGSETTSKTLQLDTYKIDTAFRGATDESRDLLLAYASRTANWEEYYADQANQGTSTKEDPKATNTPVERDPLVAGLASRGEATWDSNTNSIVVTSSAQQAGLTADDFIHQEIRDEDGNVIGHEIYRLAHNQFLESVARNTDGRALDSAALQSVFGGSAQAALLAARTSQDAVAGRVGVGASSSALTFADNGQGAGLWVAPVYVSQDSDGFAIENKDYGVDIDLYGVALGGDYTLANGLRLGAFFNVGTGDADGNGQASGVSNDFDYYSLGLYAGYSMGQFSVVGDVSYSVVDSDIDASTSVGTLKSSFDTDNISVGVTGQYELTFGATSITPHAGLRYSSISIDDYRIETGYADGGNFDSDTLSVFSVPVGVTIAQDFTAGSWQVKPSFDLTLQGNFGDDEIDASTNWDGVANWSSNYTAEFLDNFTYGATVGVAAKNGNFSAGIGLGYTGSENTDEFSATANARFVF